jgi:hypothetical protein
MGKLRSLLMILILSVAASSLRAQSSGPGKEADPGIISAERPDQTNSPDLIPQGYAQLETGFLRESDKVGDVKTINYLYNTTLIRYAPLTRMELRLLIEYAGQRVESSGLNLQVVGFNPLSMGTKISVIDQTKLIPKTSLEVSVALPYFASSPFKPSSAAPSFFLLCENEISDHLSLGYNIGVKWDGNSPNAMGAVTTSLGIEISDRVDVFVEWYMYAMKHSTSDQRSDWGLSYFVTNNLVVDVSGGVGLSASSPDAFVSCGFSVRIPH